MLVAHGGLGTDWKPPPKKRLRSCYDLEVHSKKTGVSMTASCQLDEPKTVTEYKLQTDRKTLGTTFKAQQKKARLERGYLGTGGYLVPGTSVQLVKSKILLRKN